VADTFWRLPRGIADGRTGGDYILSYQAEWEHFVSAARRGEAVQCSLEDGRHAVAVALAAIESVTTGRPVKVEAAPRRQRGALTSRSASG
jgi:predicted dehydrogenase